MKALIFGAGNLLLTDEGFGVHAIRHLAEHYRFPDEVELLDAGTLGIMVTHRLEEAELVFIVDTVIADAEPGALLRYEKDEIMLGRLPVKLSPHQIGIQEVLYLAELRGCAPAEVVLLGVVPHSLDAGSELSPVVSPRVERVSELLVEELRGRGFDIAEAA